LKAGWVRRYSSSPPETPDPAPRRRDEGSSSGATHHDPEQVAHQPLRRPRTQRLPRPSPAVSRLPRAASWAWPSSWFSSSSSAAWWWFTRGDATPTPALNGTVGVRTPTSQTPIAGPSVYAVEVATKSWLNDADLKDIETDVMNLCLALIARKDFKAADPRVLKDAERRIYRVVVGRAPTRADPELMKLEEKVKKFVWKGRSFDDSARRIETGRK
jgi:hypothetical protein